MKYKKLLVPLDGSLLSEYVLPHAEGIASGFGGEITLLHVVPEFDDASEEITPSQKANRANIVRYLERIEESIKGQNLEVHWSIRSGDPAEEIRWYVEEHEVDLILMSTHGQGESYERKVGSVAAEVLEDSTVPILMARVPESIAKL